MRFSKFIGLGAAMALVAMMLVPVLAQEDPGAGNGGVIVESNFGDDASSFNPLVTSDATSSDLQALMFPDIIAVDDVTLSEAPNIPQGMAAGWEYDETGTVLTLTLREDMFWADGEQITANDWFWAYEATKSGVVDTPRTSVLYQLDDGTLTDGTIHEVTVIDDFTLEIRLGNVIIDEETGEVVLDEEGNPVLTPNCVALSDINDISPVPSHIFDAAFGEDLTLMNNDPYFIPQSDGGFGTFGPFTDPFIEFGVQVSLLRDESYTDVGLQLGYVAPSEYILQNVEDQTIEYERFLAGDFDYLASVASARQNELRAMVESGEADFQIIEYPANGYTYMGFNTADPTNPQPGRDTEGNLIDQGLHPFFGDQMVRRALSHAVDVDALIGTRPTDDAPATGILEGNGFPIATHNHPGLSSTDDELEALGVTVREFDLELAVSMLNEAGWVDNDGNGILECEGCLYATEVDPSFEGTEFEFELLTNAGNVAREATGETLREQFAEIGVVVNFQAIEFGTLVDELLGQQFDAIIIGWSLGLPFTPSGGILAFFGVGNDIPGGGFNTGSIQNPELDALMQAADALPAAEDGSYGACDPAERDRLYAEGQALVYEIQPYLFLYAGNVMGAAQGDLGNWDPLPYNQLWNIEAFVAADR